jgi:hypothetical protein
MSGGLECLVSQDVLRPPICMFFRQKSSDQLLIVAENRSGE